MVKKTVSDISDYIVEALQDDLIQISRSAVGGGLGPNNNIYFLNVTLKTGEKFYISVTKYED